MCSQHDLTPTYNVADREHVRWTARAPVLKNSFSRFQAQRGPAVAVRLFCFELKSFYA